MNTPDPLAEIAACNDQALNTLTRSLTKSQGEFTLILARCNYTCLRSQILHLLHQRCSLNLFELTLDSSAQTIYTAIHNHVENQQPDAILVTGLESVTDLDNLLIATNRVRDLFRKFPFPVVFWVTNQVCKRLIKVAMDLYNWSSPKLEFVLPEPALMALVAETAHQALADEDNLTLDDTELQAILQSYSAQGQNFPPDFHAILCLSLGIIHTRNNHIDAAIPYYQQSLTLWQEHQSGEQMGITSLHLAWAYALKGEQYQAEIRDYVQQTWQHLHQEHCTDSLIHHSCKLGDLLRQVGDWEKLQQLAEKALTWHQQQGDVQKIAQDYGFLADVALNKRQWRDAQKFAQQGIKAWQQVSEFEIKRLGLCYFILAQSQQHLGQEKDAIATLATAREISLNATIPLHQYDPKLYVNILQNLRTLKFAQGDYLDAFHLKLEQRQIETQYGLRAFIGAGRLHPPRQVIQPGIRGRQGLSLSQIVASSGRQKDVEELLERIRRRDRKLTVIYGSSGVGKSSILQAGLVPILQQTYFEGRDIVPVLLQVYKDWVGGLDKGLVEALKKVNRSSIFANDSLETQSDPPPAPLKKGGAKRGSNIDLIGDNKRSSDSPLPLQGRGAGGVRSTLSMILNQLRQNEHSQLLTVLIFDQFEEFFFDHKDPASRREFYEFLRQCVEIPYVKVILSLREDYIYYLLELNRTTPLTNIDKNHEHILYYLGNFSAADAKAVIQSLTARSHLPFEPDLVDQLVQDLAKDLGEVRPIELQIVGYQLETEKMTTREEYQKYESKEELVEAFLADVVQDCGSGNEQVAKLVLYLLTDENNTRPLKTRADLELELEVKNETLDLVLEVLVESGIVLRVPAIPDDRYQLVHDYLVLFVRHQQSERLIKELEKEREQRKLTEAKLNQVLRQQLEDTRRSLVWKVGLGVLSGALAIFLPFVLLNQNDSYLNSRITEAKRKLSSNQDLEALVETLKAGKRLQRWSIGVNPETEIKVKAALQDVVYSIREVNSFHGHSGTVTCVSFSSDGQLIASGSEDTTIRIWTVEGRKVATFKGHEDTITSIDFSPDGKWIVSGSKDNTLKLWRIEGKERQAVATFTGHNKPVTSVSFSPNSQLIVSGSEDKTVKLWKLDGQEVDTFKHDKKVNSVSFSPNGQLIASASDDETVKLWSQDGKLIKTLNHGSSVNQVVFSPDSQIIISQLDQSLFSWRQDGFLIKKYNYNYFGEISDSNQKIFAFSDPFYSNTKYVTLLPFFNEKKAKFRLIKGHKNKVSSIDLSPDAKMLVSGSEDNTVKLWDVEKSSFETPRHIDLSGTATHINFSLNSNLFASTTTLYTRYGFSKIKNKNTELELWSLDGKLLQSFPGENSTVSFSPSSPILAAASSNKVLQIWSETGKIFTLKGTNIDETISLGANDIALTNNNHTQLSNKDDQSKIFLKGHEDQIYLIDFSADGKTIATASKDNTVKIWQRNGKLIKTLKGYKDRINNISLSSNGETLVIHDSDNNVKFLQRDGTIIKTVQGYGLLNVRFSPDGQTLAILDNPLPLYIYTNNTLTTWKIDGTKIATFKVNGWIKDFSSDGKTIVTEDDNSKQFWDLNGTLLNTFDKKTKGYSHDYRILLTVKDDKILQLWQRDGSKLATIKVQAESLYNDIYSDFLVRYRFSPDSKKIALLTSQNTVELWKTDGTFIKSIPFQIDRFANENQPERIPMNFSPNSQTFAIRSDDNTVQLWSVQGKLKQTIQGQGDAITDLSFLPNSETLAITGIDDTVKLWKTDGTLLKSLQEPRNQVNRVSHSPDGKLIAAASDDKTVKIWNREGKLIRTLKEHTDHVNDVSFSPDGKLIASASDDKTVKIWQLDGTLIKTFDEHGNSVNRVTFSPDGQFIASASDDKTVKLWSLNDKTTLSFSHDYPVTSVNFRPDGQLIASASTENVKLWSLDGKLLTTFERIGSHDVSFSPDGQLIAAGGDNNISVWDSDLDKLLERGCNWARNYLKHNPKVKERDRTLCDDIGTQE
ncbi:WD40 domain-containing protein [Coleofasciculus chthonoplastes]|uniref:WD40 domain-containing protein n=1 Tax=Coleofasciculus chthonoplastes TaxID=64178 RepID=UPI0032F3EB9E